MWRRGRWSTTFRRVSTAARGRRIEDEGDWSYSSQWWGSDSDHLTNHTVLRSTSRHGNGVVSVLAYPSSRPSSIYWPTMERWLQQRYAEVCPDSPQDDQLRILGYQWRVLRFNGNTRQSTVKVMAASKASDLGSVHYMQQGHCLAVPYIKSMVSAGLTGLASCNYDLPNALRGKKTMNVLCIGHGGGSLPLFMASKVQGAVVHIVEIDPLVISASTKAMGFPSFSVARSLGQHALTKPDPIDEVLWKGIHERLYLYESDAEKFILDNSNLYDIIFIDAYDGNDIFPHKLWDPNSAFLKALSNRLHPEHGTVVVNLHSDADMVGPDGSVASVFEPTLPMGRYVSAVCRAYKDVLLGTRRSLGFTVSVPYVCNTTLVVCRGFPMTGCLWDRNSILNGLLAKSHEVEKDMDLPFSCLEYIKRGFVLVD